MKLVANMLMLMGFVFLLSASVLVYQRNNPNRLSFAEPSISMPAISPSTKPEKLAINDLNIKLDIESGEIVNNKWPTSTTGLMHLASSPIPGEKGNAIIYGHNWKSILGELHLIKPGDQIKITNSNNEEITFNVTTTQVVEKTQSSVLNNSEDQRITLYTCTGFLDQKRLVVTALLAS